MENAHLVGRRLSAGAELEDRGCFSKRPKATFLRARYVTKSCGGPTHPHTMPVPRGRCHVPGAACPSSSHPAVRGSPTAMPPAHAARTHSQTFLVCAACPIHSTPGTGEIPSREETWWRSGAALVELSRAGEGLGCVVRVRALRAIGVLFGPASQDQAVAQWLSRKVSVAGLLKNRVGVTGRVRVPGARGPLETIPKDYTGQHRFAPPHDCCCFLTTHHRHHELLIFATVEFLVLIDKFSKILFIC